MLKVIAAIALSLSLIFLAKESIVALRTGNIPVPPPASEGKPAKPQTAYPPEKNVVFYPPVPATLPDLNKGYLFNEERMIEGAAGENGNAAAEEQAGPSVDMNTVFYAGSLIIGQVRKGLIMYPPPAKTPVPPRKTTVKQEPAPPKERNYAQLGVGDGFSGYKVVAVEADRIVFQKGSDTIEKMLNDPKKTRLAAPPPPQAKEKGKTPPPAVTAKTKPVAPDKAKAGIPVQSSRPGPSTARTVPSPNIQVPGVPPAPPAPEQTQADQ